MSVKKIAVQLSFLFVLIGTFVFQIESSVLCSDLSHSVNLSNSINAEKEKCNSEKPIHSKQEGQDDQSHKTCGDVCHHQVGIGLFKVKVATHFFPIGVSYSTYLSSFNSIERPQPQTPPPLV